MASRARTSVHEWILYGSVIIVIMAILSIIHSIPTLFPYFLDEFGESRAKTAAIQSVFFGVGLTSSIFTGVMIQHYGPKLCGIVGAILFSAGLITSAFASSTTYLLITFGVLSGLGGPPLLFLSACQAASFCFEGKSKLIGISVATSSVGIGAMVYPYLIKVTTDSLGLKGTLLVLGGISLNAVPLAVLWSNPKHTGITKLIDADKEHGVQCTLIAEETDCEKEVSKPGPETENDTCVVKGGHTEIVKALLSNNNQIKEAGNKDIATSIRRNSDGILSKFLATVAYRPFIAIVCAFASALPSLSTFEILFLDVLETSGLSRDRGITLLIVLNGVCIPARIFPGLIHKIPRCKSGFAMIIGSLLSLISLLFFNLVSGYAGNLVSSILLGASKGILLGCMSVVPLEMLGAARLATAMGIIGCVNGIIITAQGPIHGFLRDVSGSYSITVYVSAGSMLLAVMFSAAAIVLETRMKANIKK